MKILFTFILALIIGLFAGGYFGGAIAAKGSSTLAMCNMAKVAQQQNMLSQDQTLSLAEATGQYMKKHYSTIADQLKLSEESQNNVSDTSECSQFLLHFSKGIDSVK